MNREQAKNILEAYVEMECSGGDNKARQSLREVILDAMTEYRSYPITISQPRVTPTIPTVEPYKPTVTWTSTVDTGQMEVRDD